VDLPNRDFAATMPRYSDSEGPTHLCPMRGDVKVEVCEHSI